LISKRFAGKLPGPSNRIDPCSHYFISILRKTFRTETT
jgi:hypothetical protein